MTPHSYVLLAHLTLYIAFYVILNILYFDSECQPYWIWRLRRSHTKNKNHFSLSYYNFNRKRQFICTSCSSGTRDIAFNDLRTVAILDVNVEMTSKRENNHIRGFAMQQFVENDSAVVLLAHLTQLYCFLCFF